MDKFLKAYQDINANLFTFEEISKSIGADWKDIKEELTTQMIPSMKLRQCLKIGRAYAEGVLTEKEAMKYLKLNGQNNLEYFKKEGAEQAEFKLR